MIWEWNFQPLTSKGHSLDTCAGPVLESVVPTSLSQLSVGRSQLQIPVKQLGYVRLGWDAIKERKREKTK